MEIYIIAIIILVFMSAYFSATETAFSSLNKTRLKAMIEKGNKKAKLAYKLSEKYDELISTILIGNNIVNIALASISTVMFIEFINKQHGASLSTVVTTVIVLIFGEITPKSIAKDMPEKFALFASPFINILIWIFTPLNFIFSQWKKLMGKVLKIEESSKMSSEELIMLVEEVEQEGTLDTDESELIRNAIEFSDLEAEDILTHRVDLEAVSIDTPKNEIARAFATSQFSRLLVYEESIDNIVGIIHSKDFFKEYGITKQDIKNIMTKPLFIQKSEKVDDLLKILQTNKSHIAVVIDEYGGTLGIVTMEDILEELVGEIWDEHDVEVAHYFKEDDTTYIVNGNAPTDIIFELFNHEAEKDNFEANTVSGWILEYLGEIPISGTTFKFKNLQVDILQSTVKKINKVRISLQEENE